MFDYIFIPQPWLRAFHIALFFCAIGGSIYVHYLTWDLFRPLGAVRLRKVMITHQMMLGVLASIWVTGGVLIWLALPKDLLTVPKVQLKLLVVGVVTVNAYFIHRDIIRRMHSHFALGKEPWRYQIRVVVYGCISAVSWGFPFLLGLGREWNDRAKFWELLIAYLVLLVVVVVGGLIFHALHFRYVKHNRQEPDTRPMEFQPQPKRVVPSSQPALAGSPQVVSYHRRVLPIDGFDADAVEAERRQLAYTK